MQFLEKIRIKAISVDKKKLLKKSQKILSQEEGLRKQKDFMLGIYAK